MPASWDDNTHTNHLGKRDPILNRMNRNREVEKAGWVGFVLGFMLASIIAVTWYQMETRYVTGDEVRYSETDTGPVQPSETETIR